MRQDWQLAIRQAVEELGPPLFGLADADGDVRSYGGKPCSEVGVHFETPTGRIEVTTASHPLGGTTRLIHDVLSRSVPAAPHLPWSVTLDERLVMLPVLDVRTQFRVVQSSTGHWLAVGGFKKRHLLLAGSPGTNADELALRLITLDAAATVTEPILGTCAERSRPG